MDDWQFLSEYVRTGSQEAFGQIVTRHVDLVYATCRRVLPVRDAHLAEDATQAVFVILAKKARTLRRPTSLVGWLHNTARYVACNALRVAANRRRHELEAAQMTDKKQKFDPAAKSNGAEDSVDRALARLDPAERDAVLLRFFEGRSFREVGVAMSITEEAAKKRVWRGIDKLRQMLTPSGAATVPAATVAGLLATATLPAPPALAAAAATTALTGIGAAAISLAKGAVIAMAISKTKATAAAVALIALLMGGTAILLNDALNAPAPKGQTVAVKPATQPAAAGEIVGDTEPVLVKQELATEIAIANGIAKPCTHLANHAVNNKTCANCHSPTPVAHAVLLPKQLGMPGDALVLLGGQLTGQLNIQGGAGLADVTFALVGAGQNLGLNAGQEAPAIDLPGFDGVPVRLSDYKGKFVLVHFWSSKEQKTHDQLAHIHAAAKEWANEPKLVIIGINLDEHFSVASAFAKQQQMSWINAYAGSNSKLLSDYVTGAGNSVLIDPEGKIVDPTLLNLEIDDQLDKSLRPQPK